MVDDKTKQTKTQQTRTRLLSAAAEVFAKKGYERASVDDVALAAGLTKGAVYWNFASKEELFLALVRERQSLIMGEFFTAAASAEPDGYVASLADVYKHQAPDPNEWKLWMEFLLHALRRPGLTRRVRNQGATSFRALVDELDRRSASLPGTPPLSTAVLARLYTAIFDGVNQQRAIDPSSVDDDLFPALLRFVNDAYVALTR